MTTHTPNVAKALEAAVHAIYFDDNSDFGSALWQVIHHLDPECERMLEKGDGESAYRRVSPDADVDNDSVEV